MNSFLRFLDGIGGAVTYVRNFFLNVLFLILFFVFVAFLGFLIGAGDRETRDPVGGILYADIGETVFDAPLIESRIEKLIRKINGGDDRHIHAEQLRRVVDRAGKDDRIKALVMDLSGTGWVRLDIIKTLEPALAAFKKAGKKIHVYADSYTQSTYALATYADEIAMSGSGEITFPGVNVRNVYFRDLLETFRINVYTPREGSHKSAVEPFTRNDMSGPVKEEMRGIAADLWDQYKAIVAANRPGFSPDSALFGSDSLISLYESVPGAENPYLRAGAVDRITDRDGYFAELAKKYGVRYAPDPNTGLYGFRTPGAEAYYEMIRREGGNASSGDVVGVIYGLGEIDFSSGRRTDLAAFTPENILPLINTAAARKYKALVVYMNTPGGSVDSSEKIRAALENYKKASGGKVVVYMSGMAASGGYWIATAADVIVAQPSTVTGSIGVFGLMINAAELADSLGIHEDGAGTNPGGMPSLVSPLTDNQKKMAQLRITRTYARFLELVSASRGIAPEKAREIAGGRIYTGREALGLKLVDRLGTYGDAVAEARKLAKNDRAAVRVLIPDDTAGIGAVTDALVRMTARFSRPAALDLLGRLFPAGRAAAAAAARGDGAYLVEPYEITY